VQLSLPDLDLLDTASPSPSAESRADSPRDAAVLRVASGRAGGFAPPAPPHLAAPLAAGVCDAAWHRWPSARPLYAARRARAPTSGSPPGAGAAPEIPLARPPPPTPDRAGSDMTDRRP